MKRYLPAFAGLIAQHKAPLAFGFLHTFMSSPGQTFFVALFVASFGQSLGLGVGTLGTIYLVGTLGAAMLLPLVGHWIDRVDLRLFSGLAALGLAAACLVTATATTAIALGLGIVLLRLTGQGLMTHIEATATARYFGPNRGKALSLTAMGMPMAEGLMPSVMALLLAAIGWRYAYAAIAGLILLVFLPVTQMLLAGLAGYSAPPARPAVGTGARLRTGLTLLVRSRFFWMAIPLLLYNSFTSTALLFHIQSVASARGLAFHLIAPAFLGLATMHGLALLLSGPMIDRFSARLSFPLVLLPLLLGMTLVATVAHPAMTVVMMAGMGVSSGFNKTIVSALWAEVFGVHQLGAIRSAVATLSVGATAAGPAALGYAMDLGAPILATLPALIVVGFLATAVAALAARMGPS